MKSIFSVTTKNQFVIFGYVKALFLFLLMSACFTSSLHAGQVGQPSPVDNMNFPDSQGIRNGVMASGGACPAKEEIVQKTRTLQMPFIANNGQVDEQVRFYAKTFGGTVFVTKEGEIVYSLPSGRDVPAGASQESGRSLKHGVCRDALHASLYYVGQGSSGAEEQGGKVVSGWHGQAPLVRAEFEFVVAYAYSPLFRADNANCPPDRVFAKSLIAAYLPGFLVETTRRVVCPSSTPPNQNPQSTIQNLKSDVRGIALKETILGAKIGGIAGEQPTVTTVNYFIGNDASKWKTNIPTYNVVNLGDIYKGIELSLRAYGNNVEKLFCVKPGADPCRIKIGLSGVKERGLQNRKSELQISTLQINTAGELVAETEFGSVRFTKPVAYQEREGKRVYVAVDYSISVPEIDEDERWRDEKPGGGEEPETQNLKPETGNSKLTYGFTVASYDKTKDLIIDPLLASTYLGGAGDEYGNFIVLDTGGNIYVTGTTWSIDFPTTSGAYDNSYNGDGGTFHERGGDVFVAKLDGGLTSLLVSTYLGGSSDDIGYSIAFDTSENVYVTGTTWSTDFPTTSGVYDDSFNGGRYRSDVFVSKLDSGLTSLQASTYLGGTDYEDIPSLTIDTSGNVYVTGRTGSADFPTTIGAYDTSHNSAYYWDVFVSKLDSELTNLLASTFLGGQSSEGGESIRLDTNGNVYVTGYTFSKDFPTTPGAYNTTRIDMIYSDVFVSKLDGELTSLLASTYLAGTDFDFATSLSLASDGNIYLTGYTYSPDFPTTSEAYDTTVNDMVCSDVFVSKLDGELTSLLASTYLGGYNWDYSHSLVFDTSGNVYVAGYTYSRNFPTTSGAYDTSLSGISDTFVSKLDGGLTSLLASTYLGGSSEDNCYSSTLDENGNVYVAGVTNSNNFPTTSSTYDASFNGAIDVFVSKLDNNLSVTDECMAEAIATFPDKLTLKKNESNDVTITVTGDDDCAVEGVTVTATIIGNGKRLISVSSGGRETDVNGQTVFTINAKNKKGTAIIKFGVSGLDKFVKVQVKVRQ